MNELQDTCSTLLPQSTLSLTVDSVTSSIRMAFSTSKKSEVCFLAHEYVQFHVYKQKENETDFQIDEVSVEILSEQEVIQSLYAQFGWEDVLNNDIEPLFKITIRGQIAIDLICARLAWRLDDNDYVVPTLAHKLM